MTTLMQQNPASKPSVFWRNNNKKELKKGSSSLIAASFLGSGNVNGSSIKSIDPQNPQKLHFLLYNGLNGKDTLPLNFGVPTNQVSLQIISNLNNVYDVNVASVSMNGTQLEAIILPKNEKLDEPNKSFSSNVDYGGRLPLNKENDFSLNNEREFIDYKKNSEDVYFSVSYGGRLPITPERG